MLKNLFFFTLRQRYLGVVIGMGAVTSMVALGVWAYGDIAEQLAEMVKAMPPAVLGMIGLEAGFNASNIVLAEIVNLIGPLVLCGLAISMGTASIAGEERADTLGILLGNPWSRVEVLAAKMGAAMLLLMFGGALLFGMIEATLAVFGSAPDVQLAATIVHMVVLAMFFAALSACIGAWTGNAGLANGVNAGVLVVSWLAVGLLPMFPEVDDVARVFPWYYFSGSHPLSNGVEWSHIAVLVGGTVALLSAAVVGVQRRDLRFGAGQSILDRLKGHPIGMKVVERFRGGDLVSNITMRTVSEAQTTAVMVAFYTALLSILMGPLFNSLSDVLKKVSEVFPKALLAMVGFADMSTAEGFYVAEVFSMVAPGVVIFVGGLMGIRALAGEEAAGTMGVLLANPIARWRVVVEKAAAIAIIVAIVSFGIFIGVVGGSLLGGLGMSTMNIAAACAQTFALGVFFGMLALAGGAAFGKKNIATYLLVGTALLSWSLNAFLPVDPAKAEWAKVSPVYYYTENMPLMNGISWMNMGVLLTGAAVLLGMAVMLFERRDLHG